MKRVHNLQECWESLPNFLSVKSKAWTVQDHRNRKKGLSDELPICFWTPQLKWEVFNHTYCHTIPFWRGTLPLMESEFSDGHLNMNSYLQFLVFSQKIFFLVVPKITFYFFIQLIIYFNMTCIIEICDSLRTRKIKKMTKGFIYSLMNNWKINAYYYWKLKKILISNKIKNKWIKFYDIC